jgi:hypothetical protein
MKTKHILSLLFLASVVITGCEKDFDSPPIKELPEGNVLTIDSVRNIYTAFDTTIVGDYSVYGTVTADETFGNFYKELYIQDETNAIKLDLTSSGDYFVGDRIRVSLKGTTITRDNNMIIISEVDPAIHLIKQKPEGEIMPEVVTISDLTITSIYTPFQSKLVQINNVEFKCSDVCNSWADPVAQSDENRELIDTSGFDVIVRSSGFSSFAGEQLPFGQGSIIGIVTQFGTTLQLSIRNPSEFTMKGTRKTNCPACPTYIYTKNWDNGSLTSGGWTTQYPTPNNLWYTDNFPGSNYYAVIDNTSSQLVGESWLISPNFNLNSTSTPQVNFSTAARSGTSASSLQIMVSNNYDGTSAPSSATWTDITSSFLLSSGSWNWTGSGNYNLSAYKSTGVYIAFKYTSTGSSRDTWEIDNFNIIDL